MAKKRVFQTEEGAAAEQTAPPTTKKQKAEEPAKKADKKSSGKDKAVTKAAKDDHKETGSSSSSSTAAASTAAAAAADKPSSSSSSASSSSSSSLKISAQNVTKNTARRYYTVITPETLKDPAFRGLTALYIGSFLWEQSLWTQFEETIKLMPRLETLVVKDPLISVKLLLQSASLKNFGLHARGLKKLDIVAPQLESMAIVHTLNCGTGFFADLMIDTPNLKYLSLWENYGVIQVTTSLDHLETLVISRTSATKLSCDHILQNFQALKTMYVSCIDVTPRTASSWKKKYGVDVHIEANRDFFSDYLIYLDDFDNLSLFHEEQKY